MKGAKAKPANGGAKGTATSFPLDAGTGRPAPNPKMPPLQGGPKPMPFRPATGGSPPPKGGKYTPKKPR